MSFKFLGVKSDEVSEEKKSTSSNSKTEYLSVEEITGVLEVTEVISSADLKASAIISSEVLLPEGYYADVKSVSAEHVFNTAAYSVASMTGMDITLSGGASVYSLSSDIITEASSQLQSPEKKAGNVVEASVLDGTLPLFTYSTVGGFSEKPTLGDGDLILKIKYSLMKFGI